LRDHTITLPNHRHRSVPLGQMVQLIGAGEISGKIAKEILPQLLEQ
jgi:Asp-tRNA(Asn)/Glu-tRNA(Gln) amidotransferase B subunit